MKIGEFAKKAGMTPATVRFYASKGFFVGKRAGNGYREFDDTDLGDAEWIAIGRSFGIGLDDIRLLLAQIKSPVPDDTMIQATLDAHLARIDARILHLQRMRGMLVAKVASCAVDGAAAPGR